MCRFKLALFFAANLIVLSSAQAADAAAGAVEASLTWRLGFGAGALQPGYGLAVGYRAADPDALSGRLLQLDVAQGGAQASLAGLPVLSRSDRRSQNEAAGAAPAAGPSPWYARKWVWWTLGALAGTVALAGGGGSLTIEGSNSNRTGNGTSCTGVSGNVGDTETPCTSETVGTQCVEGGDGQVVCVFCGNNGVTDGCSEWTDRRVVPGRTVDVRHQRWLDAGTGHMGDLPLR